MEKKTVSKFDIRNINGKFIVVRNDVPLLDKTYSANKVTEFVSVEDAQKYVEILKILDKKKHQTSRI